jgi:hypothetical protein
VVRRSYIKIASERAGRHSEISRICGSGKWLMIHRHRPIPVGYPVACRTCARLGGNRDSAVIFLGPAMTSVVPPCIARDSSVPETASDLVKLRGDFTGSDVPAKSQPVRREFDRNIDPLRWGWSGQGLRGPPQEMAGHIIGHGIDRTLWRNIEDLVCHWLLIGFLANQAVHSPTFSFHGNPW